MRTIVPNDELFPSTLTNGANVENFEKKFAKKRASKSRTLFDYFNLDLFSELDVEPRYGMPIIKPFGEFDSLPMKLMAFDEPCCCCMASIKRCSYYSECHLVVAR